MTALRGLQEDFQSYLLHLDDSMAGKVADAERASAAERLQIYAEAYRLRLIEALADSYPALHTLLGDEQFDRLCRHYIDAHPSPHRSIRWFGDRLADFLRDTAPYTEQPVLAEMAAFEWRLRDAFDAADRDPATIDHIAAVAPQAWPEMRLGFHPAVARLDLEWNVPALWKAIDQDEVPEPPQCGPYPIPWVIWRKELRQYYRSMDVDEAWALDAARDGASFAALCEGLCEWIDVEHAPVRAAGFLKGWASEHMLTAIHTG